MNSDNGMYIGLAASVAQPSSAAKTAANAYVGYSKCSDCQMTDVTRPCPNWDHDGCGCANAKARAVRDVVPPKQFSFVAVSDDAMKKSEALAALEQIRDEIIPLLEELKALEGDYIYWPNRKKEISDALMVIAIASNWVDKVTN